MLELIANTVKSSAAKIFGSSLQGQSEFGVLTGIFPTNGTPPQRGTAELIKAYNDFPWCRAIVSRIATSAASPRWRLYVQRNAKSGKAVRNAGLAAAPLEARRKEMRGLLKRSELTELTDHPFIDAMIDPNPYLSGTQMRKLNFIYGELAGEAFVLKQRNEFGMPIVYWPIPPNSVLATPSPSKPIFKISINSVQVDVPESEMVWFNDPDPRNPLGRGSGFARAVVDELEIDEYAAKFLKSFFFNSARPDILISSSTMQKEDLQRARQDWMKNLRGFWRSHLPHFIRGELKVEVLSQDFQSMQFVELRKNARDFCQQTWGLPPEQLGILQSSNRATIEASDYLFNKNIIIPRLEAYREKMQKHISADYDDRLILEYETPSLEDKQFSLSVATTAPWSRTFDEWRELQGLEPAEDERIGKLVIVPLGARFVDQSELLDESDADTFALDTGPDPDDDDFDDEEENEDEEVDEDEEEETPEEERELEFSRTKKAFTLTKADQVYKIVNQTADRYRARMRKEFTNASAKHRKTISVSAIEKAYIARNSGEIERECNLDDLVARQFGDALNDKPRAVASVWLALYEAAGIKEAEALNDLLGLKAAKREGDDQTGFFARFDMASPSAAEFAKRNIGLLITSVTEAQVRAVREIIETAFLVGWTPRESATMIRDVVGLTPRQVKRVAKLQKTLLKREVEAETISKRIARLSQRLINERALLIARTETITAANGGRQALWKQAERDGLIDSDWTRRWIVTPDDRLDEVECLPMAGQEVGLDEPFITGTGKAIMHPTAHPRCRCSMRLVRPSRRR